MQAIERIRAAVEHESDDLMYACGHTAMREVLAHIDKLEDENERLRKDAERKPMDREEMMDGYCNTPQCHQFVQAFEAGVLYAEAFHDIKETP